MKATRTAETETAKIEISLTREVTDKVAYADGYNIKTGREVYESYDITITSKKNGKSVHTYGKPNFSFSSKWNTMPEGAFARIGDAYISEATYRLMKGMIAELDAEVGKSDEQVALEVKAEAQKKAYDELLDQEAAEYARKIKNGFCPKCHSYCYGDCEAN